MKKSAGGRRRQEQQRQQRQKQQLDSEEGRRASKTQSLCVVRVPQLYGASAAIDILSALPIALRHPTAVDGHPLTRLELTGRAAQTSVVHAFDALYRLLATRLGEEVMMVAPTKIDTDSSGGSPTSSPSFHSSFTMVRGMNAVDPSAHACDGSSIVTPQASRAAEAAAGNDSAENGGAEQVALVPVVVSPPRLLLLLSCWSLRVTGASDGGFIAEVSVLNTLRTILMHHTIDYTHKSHCAHHLTTGGCSQHAT
jgi:hypothetical protein